jgi:hypothetical protein
LAVHSLANAEENVLGTVCGLPIERVRDEEFRASIPIDDIRAQLQDLVERMTRAAQKTPVDLDEMRSHPRRGEFPVRNVLIVAARHAAEHMGQAQLTKDLLVASRSNSK